MDIEEKILRVSNTTYPPHLAGSISKTIKDGKKPVVRAVGPQAVNQAMKAIAIASGMVAERGYDLVTRAGFDSVSNLRFTGEQGQSEEISCMLFRLEAR